MIFSSTLTKRSAPLIAAALLWFVAALTARAWAQDSPAPLPTAPGADRAANGGLTEAHPSLPSEPGRSPLEPYLVLWLLPVSGILTVAAAIFVDRRMLALKPRRR